MKKLILLLLLLPVLVMAQDPTNSVPASTNLLNLPPGFEQAVEMLPPNIKAWVKQALAWVGSFSFIFALIGGIIGRWLRNKLNKVTESEGSGQDAKLRAWFSNPAYVVLAYLLRIVSINLPTVAELDRAVRLQREAVADATGQPKP